MPFLDTFQHLGLFGIREFLDRGTCAAICAELRGSRMEPVTILSPDGAFVVNRDVRSTKLQLVSPTTGAAVAARLAALKPRLEEHFGVALEDCRPPDFLAYEEGDFYKPHRDNSSTADAPTPTQYRKISAVVFLNGQSAAPDAESYGGGALTFYGLVDDPLLKTRGMPLVSEPGMLVAFPATTVHEVQPVTHGLRYTIVTWFY